MFTTISNFKLPL